VQDIEKIGCAESKPNAGRVLLDEFLRIEADDFGPRVEQRSA
jgi:hypothetical protein